MVEEKYHNNGA